MNDYTVYMHISPSNKRYIGITCQSVERRWRNGNGYKENKYFTNAIKHYGWDNFKHIIIARGLTEEVAKWLEIELIRELNTNNRDKGYNITRGGEGVNGYYHTEETRKKISENNAKYWKGKQVPKEARKKMSEAQIEIWKNKTDEEVKKRSKKISEAHKISIICITTKKIFKSLEEASRTYGLKCCSGITNCCKGYKIENGKKKPVYSAGKYNGKKLKWKYITYNHNKRLRPIENKIKRVTK